MSLILDGNHAASAIKHKVREAIAESAHSRDLLLFWSGMIQRPKFMSETKQKTVSSAVSTV